MIIIEKKYTCKTLFINTLNDLNQTLRIVFFILAHQLEYALQQQIVLFEEAENRKSKQNSNLY